MQPLLARQDADFRYADQALSAPESLAALLEQGGDWYRQLYQLDAQARAAWRAARVELEALLRDLRPYLNGNSYRGKDSDETFDAWLQALADWSEGGEQPANLGKFGPTRIKLTAKRVAPEHAALRAIDAWAAHRKSVPISLPTCCCTRWAKSGANWRSRSSVPRSASTTCSAASTAPCRGLVASAWRN